MSIDTYRLARDLEHYRGQRPEMAEIADAAMHLAVRGTYHLIDTRGERIILAREHYEAAPDDLGELDVKPASTFPAPDVLMYGVLIFIAAFASAWHLLDGNTFAASWFGGAAVVMLGWAAVCIAWDRGRE